MTTEKPANLKVLDAERTVFDSHFFSLKITEESVIETIKDLLKKRYYSQVQLGLIRVNEHIKLTVRILPENPYDRAFSEYFCIPPEKQEVISAFYKNSYLDGLITTFESKEGEMWLTFKADHYMITDAKLIKRASVKITTESFSFATEEDLDDCLNLSPKERYSIAHSLNYGSSVLLIRATQNRCYPLNGIFFVERSLLGRENLFALLAKKTVFSLTSEVEEDGRTWLTFKPC